MKTNLILLFLSLSLSADEADKHQPSRSTWLPQVPSRLDNKTVKSLLENGITQATLSKELNTLPVMMGLCHTLYILADATLVIPPQEDGSKVIINWELNLSDKSTAVHSEMRAFLDDGRIKSTTPYTHKIQDAEQPGPAQPATKPADKPSVKDQPSTPTSKVGPR